VQFQCAYGGKYFAGIARLLDEIVTTCQRQPPNFDDVHSIGTTGEPARCNPKWKIQDGGL